MTNLGFAGDKRLKPALEILKDKRQSDGTWLLDKLHPDLGAGTSYNLGWLGGVVEAKPLAVEESGKPSKWITLTALRVLKRVEDQK
jgi:hypothetical protein